MQAVFWVLEAGKRKERGNALNGPKTWPASKISKISKICQPMLSNRGTLRVRS